MMKAFQIVLLLLVGFMASASATTSLINNHDWLQKIKDAVKDTFKPLLNGTSIFEENEVAPAPTGYPSLAPTDVPTPSPSDFPSDVPTDVPTLAPSDAPSDIPSDAPSDIPSDVPSDVPSAIPTPSPTAFPTAQPSSAPFRRPTSFPTPQFSVEANEADLLPGDFSPCGSAEGLDFTSTIGMRVLYMYRLRLDENVEVKEVIHMLESVVLEALKDTNCQSSFTSSEVFGISSRPEDSPLAECGPQCFIMLGRVSLLVDADIELSDRRELYCSSLLTARDMIEFGGLSNIAGVDSTQNLRIQGEELPYACIGLEVNSVESIPSISNNNESGEIDDNAFERGHSILFSVLGMITVGSAFFIALGIVVSRRRRQHAAETSIIRQALDASYPPQIVSKDSELRFSAISSLDGTEFGGLNVFVHETGALGPLDA